VLIPMKASGDGKSPGFPVVVFGGPKADIPDFGWIQGCPRPGAD
jgi:hypothetical protein